MEVVGKVECNQRAGRWRVDAHVVRRVVEELGSRVAFHVVWVVVAPAQLHVNPVLLCRCVVHRVPSQRTTTTTPLTLPATRQHWQWHLAADVETVSPRRQLTMAKKDEIQWVISCLLSGSTSSHTKNSASVTSAFYPPWDGKMSTSQRAVMICGWGV